MENISIDKILNCDVVESCTQPDHGKLYNKTANMDFDAIGLKCEDFTEGRQEKVQDHSITSPLSIKLQNILCSAEHDCMTGKYKYFLDLKNELGVVFVAIVSIIFAYFRFKLG